MRNKIIYKTLEQASIKMRDRPNIHSIRTAVYCVKGDHDRRLKTLDNNKYMLNPMEREYVESKKDIEQGLYNTDIIEIIREARQFISDKALGSILEETRTSFHNET